MGLLHSNGVSPIACCKRRPCTWGFPDSLLSLVPGTGEGRAGQESVKRKDGAGGAGGGGWGGGGGAGGGSRQHKEKQGSHKRKPDSHKKKPDEHKRGNRQHKEKPVAEKPSA